MFGNETTIAPAVTNMTTASPTPAPVITTTSTDVPVPTTDAPVVQLDHICKRILYEEFLSSGARTWDWIIMVPNVCFMMFLIANFRTTKARLLNNTSPVIVTFYVLVVVSVLTSVLRCIVSMSVNAATTAGERTDKVLWVAVRFFLLSMEISVLVFGLAFGHLDSRTSIRRVLVVTACVAFAYSLIQGTLEIIAPDEKFYVDLAHNSSTSLYGHGGTGFWAFTSLLFSLIYATVFALPFTPINRRIQLPTKKSFYAYCAILSLLNSLQGIGSIAYANSLIGGLCIIDFTTYLYFSFFNIFVYCTFLSTLFSLNPTSLLFNYKHQLDDIIVTDDPLDEQDETVNSQSTINALNNFEFSAETSVLSLKTAEEPDVSTLVDVSMLEDPTIDSNTISQYFSPNDEFDEDTIVSDSGSFATARGDSSSKSQSISEMRSPVV